jgi:hypothetical protein
MKITKEFEDAFKDLIQKSGKNLSVIFNGARSEKTKKVSRRPDYFDSIVWYIDENDSMNELADNLIEAERQVGELIDIKAHERLSAINHPDGFIRLNQIVKESNL